MTTLSAPEDAPNRQSKWPRDRQSEPAVTALLKVRDLCLTRLNKLVLKKINFKIGNYPLTFILGPNGAGKSLLLHVLYGLYPPNTGQITWSPIVPRACRRFIFQRPILLKRSVLGNMKFVAKRLKLDKAVIFERLDAVKLLDKRSQRADLLSGGEQQKLAFARETLGQHQKKQQVPQKETDKINFLLLDEPTANLDPASKLEIELLIQEAVETGTRLIIVSHDLHQVQRLAHKVNSEVLFLNEGELIYQNKAGDFLSPYNQASKPEPVRLFLCGSTITGSTLQ